MKNSIQILKVSTFFFIVALLSFVSSFILPGSENITCTGALASAFLFNPANISTWQQKVNAFIASKRGSNGFQMSGDSYPMEWRKLVSEVTVTQNTRFNFPLKEDQSVSTVTRQQRLGLNDTFFAFAARFAIIDETLATPYNHVSSTSAIIAAHNVFYNTGYFSLSSGNVEVFNRLPVGQFKFNPNSQAPITENDGVAVIYPTPILSGRNDIRLNLEIGDGGASIIHATPLTNRYVLQVSLYGFNVVGLAKDIETSLT